MKRFGCRPHDAGGHGRRGRRPKSVREGTREIAEDRGAEAGGCRLDHRALEEIVGLASSAVAGSVDLLLINKLCKREAAGHGFMPVRRVLVSHGSLQGYEG